MLLGDYLSVSIDNLAGAVASRLKDFDGIYDVNPTNPPDHGPAPLFVALMSCVGQDGQLFEDFDGCTYMSFKSINVSEVDVLADWLEEYRKLARYNGSCNHDTARRILEGIAVYNKDRF